MNTINHSSQEYRLSTDSFDLLLQRKLSKDDVVDFSALLQKARELQDKKTPAKEILSSLSDDELSILQKATGLVDPIEVDALSEEGATNLLSQPDRSEMVDLNNDGLIEVGMARVITFPPVNAPAHIKSAWENATKHMSEQDKMTMQLHMHTAVYGFHIDGITTKEVLPAEQQWSEPGWRQLLEELRGALEFSVSMDGWTRTSVIRNDFYNKFESELTKKNSA